MIVKLDAFPYGCIFLILETRKTFRHNATLKDACYLVDTANIFCLFWGIVTWPALVELPLFL